MNKLTIPALLVTGVMTTGSLACEFHGGMFGGGAYGTEWRTYDSAALDALLESTYGSDDDQSEAAEDTRRKARPVFSSSAARAVESAKARAVESDATSESAEEATETN